ncbi:MAG TPA: hypothetical protein VFU00_11455 [Gemmatimonadales bacterium]|nr:hypothetical protein [Gemmatimonadales bacterium]
MRFPFSPLVLAAALGACADAAGPTAPDALPAVNPPADAALASLAPLEDALVRVVPALGPGSAAAAIRGLLTAAVSAGAAPDASAFDSALDQLAADPALAADADAIRLALAASR